MSDPSAPQPATPGSDSVREEIADQAAADRHTDAVADTGHGYTVEHRRPWHLSCLWCEYETSGHRTKGDAMSAMSEHYSTVTGVPGWTVTR